MGSKNNRIEKRKYIRVNTVFPVEFRVLARGGEPISSWFQGFSQDISSGGLCLFANLIKEDSWEIIKNYD